MGEKILDKKVQESRFGGVFSFCDTRKFFPGPQATVQRAFVLYHHHHLNCYLWSTTRKQGMH